MTTDLQLEEDLATVAHHAAASAVEDMADDGWDLYPDLGLYDWEAVQEKMKAATPYPNHAAYLAAYGRLSARAEK